MEFKIDKKVENKKLGTPFKWNTSNSKKGVKDGLKKGLKSNTPSKTVTGWNFLYAFIVFPLLFLVLIINVAKLQIIEGNEMTERSKNNKVRITKVSASRGVIFDSNGQKLVENTPSVNVYVSVDQYLDTKGELDNEYLQKTLDTLQGILENRWENSVTNSDKIYTSISEKIFELYHQDPYTSKILVAKDVDNDTVIKIKAKTDELKGVTLDNGSKRHYIYNEYFGQILGYTGEASSQDIEKLEDVSSGDIIGKAGIERKYNLELQGVSGKLAEEVDAWGRAVNLEPYVLENPQPGKNLYLSINKDIQVQMYEVLKQYVNKVGANGGAGVIEDVNTGEIVAIVSYPGYDNNLFIGGISQTDYNNLLQNPQLPLLNRAIAAQMPPGSTFKTIVAAAALDAKAITTNTIYVSRSGYTFSNGAPFQDFHNHAYGPLNVVSALSVSSNIYFCELIRDWDMNKLVKYLEKFGIGEYTGIDIPGEMPGRLPSPENKIKLANTTNPWLDPIWYPEGDSCNSVIGQGITLVTPVQMSNWMAAIANGGTLYTPHIAKKFVDEKGLEYTIENTPKYTNIASSQALETTRKGMWESVNGSRGVARAMSLAGVEVAAKTGTAEFGTLNSKGIYEHTHAWVGGFFPYNNPKYSFSLFLEDGGSSSNATAAMKDIISWMNENGLLE